MSRFPTTSWTLIRSAQDADIAHRRVLLGALIDRYWRAVYCFVRARNSASDAEDLTQQFFATLLARGDVDRLSSEFGSFRGFLHAALRNFLSNAGRAARARPPMFPYAEADAAWLEDPAPSPDEAFERRWAMDVFAVAFNQLEQEMTANGRQHHFEIFKAYADDRAAGGELTYRKVAERFGVEEDDVRNRLREVRIRLRALTKNILSDYLAPGEDVEKEMALLLGQ